MFITSGSPGNKDIHKERPFGIKAPAWHHILEHEGAFDGLGQP